MGKYFGTDGFRGEANVNLTVEHAFKIGRFLGSFFYGEDKARIVIGKDTRRSGYMLEYALCAGITASGGDAYLLHVTTTPSVSYIARTENFDCGVMISASHNPYFDNGIKLINSRGEKMGDEVLGKIESYLDGNYPEIPLAKGENIGRTVDYSGGRNRYIAYIISLSKHSYKGLKIGLDCSNGSTWMMAKSIFDTLGAKTFVTGNEPDGININLNCGSTHIETLVNLVRENNLDIGFAFDGDADRCLAVDEKGNVLTGDHILYFYGKYMKKREKLFENTLVTTLMSNYGLFKALENNGISAKVTDVGDKFVYEEMKRGGFALGGEESGHIIFSKYASTGDGLITAVKIMEAFIESKLPASKLSDGFKLFPQVQDKIKVSDKDRVLNDNEIKDILKKRNEELKGQGRVILRKSGTEPVIRVMAEAQSNEKCSKLVNELIDLIVKKGYTE